MDWTELDWTYLTNTPFTLAKKGLVKPDLTEWKQETEKRGTEFSMGFKLSLTCMFNVLHLKSKNIGSSSFYEEKNLNRIKQNAFKKCLSFGVNGVYV